MKKPIGIVLMVVGLIGVALGFGYTASSSSREECERFHQEALANLERATQVEGTPQAQELVAEAQTQSELADIACEHADLMRRDGLLISLGGLLLAGIGFFLFRKGKAAAPPPAG
jgi:hypothetical protein